MRDVTSMQRHFHSSATGQALKFKLVIAGSGFKPVKSNYSRRSAHSPAKKSTRITKNKKLTNICCANLVDVYAKGEKPPSKSKYKLCYSIIQLTFCVVSVGAWSDKSATFEGSSFATIVIRLCMTLQAKLHSYDYDRVRIKTACLSRNTQTAKVGAKTKQVAFHLNSLIKLVSRK